jgi:integrase
MMTDPDSGAATWVKAPCVGPLVIPIETFAARLGGEGFTSRTVQDKCELVAKLSAWLYRRDLSLDALDEGCLDQFHTDRRRQGQTGLRACELLGLRCQDIVLGPSAHVQCLGKGRKVRSTPLRKETAIVLRNWFQEHHGQPSRPAFQTTSGRALSHDGLQYLLNKHLAVARRQCASLSGKHVTPHVLRHTLAMDLLHHGVDRSVIALWLGHESVETTSIYLHADMQLKEAALAKTPAPDAHARRYRPDDHLLTFLKSL